MKNFLVIYAHPDPLSFNHAILDKVLSALEAASIPCTIVDLYQEGYDPVLSKEELKGAIAGNTRRFQEMISAASNIVFIFPVFWFRAPAILEGFVDKVFVPGFAYQFKRIIGTYGIPMPLLKDKKVLTIVTHGAPALPVKTIYLNAVKYRFLLGFLSFCFYIWNCRFIQLWSVPFVEAKTRERYLSKVERAIKKQFRH